MKIEIEIEPRDAEAIAAKVVDKLRPYLTGDAKQQDTEASSVRRQ